jgi:peptidoglycan hydrolase FlgJ
MATKMEIFGQKYGAAAANAAAGSPVFMETILTAAAHESGFGQSKLAAVHNNFFGIKAGKRWKGNVVSYSTGEQTKDGKKYHVVAKFRSYPSAEVSFKDYVKLITGPRYTKAGVSNASSPAEQFKRLQAAGYATDVNYANKLIKLYNSVENWVVNNPEKAVAAGGGTLLLLTIAAFLLFKK